MTFASGLILAAAGWLVSGGPGGGADLLHSFTGSPDAEYPSSDLVLDGEGNIYGMSVLGGQFGSGTVYRLSPATTGWQETVLYSFTSGADGGQPYGGVTLDAEGNLYGTAVVGGSGNGGPCVDGGCGVVWKLTKGPGGAWAHSVLHDFSGGDDGYGPGGPVVFDAFGNLYGTTATGGAYGLGVVYQLVPDGSGDWTFHVVHAFKGSEDGGSGSAGRLLVDADQTIYGVATTGGAHGLGTVFRIAHLPNGTWKLTTLYSFQGDPDGVFPYGGLVRDPAGNLYGTTYYGGAEGDGTIYRLAPGKDGGWTETVLWSFTGGDDGAYSIAHLVRASSGTLYGTTSEDGSPGCGCGTVFALSPPVSGPFASKRWHMHVVHQFEGTPDDGAYPYNGLVADPAGHLYGTTVHGGEDDDGVVFEITPP